MATQVREGDWVRVSVGMDGVGRVTEVDEGRGCVEVKMQDGREVRLGCEWVVPVDFEAEAESIFSGPGVMPEAATIVFGWHFFLMVLGWGALGGAAAAAGLVALLHLH